MLAHEVVITDKIEGNLACDVVYQTRIQQERFASKGEADLYRGHFSLNREIYQQVLPRTHGNNAPTTTRFSC